jgi:hypothetical protein
MRVWTNTCSCHACAPLFPMYSKNEALMSLGMVR